MTKEYWYFVSGILVVLLPLLALVAVKKLHLLDVRPDNTLVYTQAGAPELTLHAFPAKNRLDDKPAPALLLFHGGSWLVGSPRDMYPQCEYFSTQGFSCFSAQYRLGDGNIPDVQGAIEDARGALDYLLENAAELHIDPLRIAVGGGSSGGHLAAALGSGLPASAGSPTMHTQRPAALLLYNPMLNLAPGKPDHHLVTDYWEQVSPYHHIDSDVPPALILLGSQDLEVPVPTAQAYCEKMHHAGGHCEIALYEGEGHGFYHKPKYQKETNQRILEFLSATQK